MLVVACAKVDLVYAAAAGSETRKKTGAVYIQQHSSSSLGQASVS